MRTAWVAVIVAAAVLLSRHVAHADPPSQHSFRAFGTEQGLGNLSILAITQTRDGLLWVATEDGLYSFDGTDFSRFAGEDGLPSSQLVSLLPDAQGLWVGTEHGLVLFDRDHDVPAASTGVPADRINALATAPDGSIWVATDHGLFRGRTGHFEAAPGFPTGVIGAVTVLADGRVVAGSGSDIVVGSATAGWRRAGSAAGFGRDRIDQTAQTPDGSVWIRSARVLWECDATALSTKALRSQATEHFGLACGNGGF